ncbi:MAG TPA: acyl transferase [Chitinophagaceae bacterium]|nr:acyl transferase [Chitinophagaceae bacterium]
MSCEWHDKIFSVSENNFRELALEIFRFQYASNPVYRTFIDALRIRPETIDVLESIPFLPISFFKTDEIKTGKFNAEAIFESSGTTPGTNSHHHVKDISLYAESFARGFQNVYGQIGEWCILGLLPSYLEKGNSSLVFMVEKLIEKTAHPQSGFYLADFERLRDTLALLEKAKQKTLLIGVTYALLDFAEQFPMQLYNTLVMETGGMKGKREELTRMEVHERLKKAFGKNEIHSEYGMTELLSQAYAVKEGKFSCPAWMRVMIRDEEDPLAVYSLQWAVSSGQSTVSSQQSAVSSQSGVQRSPLTSITGAINIIDLANVYSCSFIATEDLGKVYPDNSFEVLGRMDGSDLRGCSLLTL